MQQEEHLYNEFIRSHHGSKIEPATHDFTYSDATVTSANRGQKEIGTMREDPFSMDFGRQTQMRKEAYKPLVDASEFQKHQRGAFRQTEESPIFTMNPKSEEFKAELNRR